MKGGDSEILYTHGQRRAVRWQNSFFDTERSTSARQLMWLCRPGSYDLATAVLSPRQSASSIKGVSISTTSKLRSNGYPTPAEAPSAHLDLVSGHAWLDTTSSRHLRAAHELVSKVCRCAHGAGVTYTTPVPPAALSNIGLLQIYPNRTNLQLLDPRHPA